MLEISVDRRNRKKLKMKAICPTDGKSERAWKNIKLMFDRK